MGLFFRKVAYTSCDVIWFEEQMDFKTVSFLPVFEIRYGRNQASGSELEIISSL
jgi:hypothetical protein